MHAMAYHIPEFLWLHKGNIVQFTQQGLEKLNDISTKNFQRSLACASLWPALTWFLKIDPVWIVGLRVCVSAPEAINNYVVA